MINNDKCFTRICYCIAFFVTCATLLPFVYIVFVSISDSASIASGDIFSLNNELSLTSYFGLFRYGDFSNSFVNSVILSVCGVLLNMTLTIPCAYSLSRRETKGKNFIYAFLIFAMFFRGEILPTYVWMSKLGLIGNYFAVWLSKLVSIHNILILARYFEGIPQNILDAAKLDGAGPFYTLFRIVLPMSKTALIGISVLYFATWWNDYYYTMIYIRNPEQYTLPVRIIQMISNIEDSSVYSAQDMVYSKLSAYGVQAAGIVLSIVPVILLILMLQRKNGSIYQIFKKQKKENNK